MMKGWFKGGLLGLGLCGILAQGAPAVTNSLSSAEAPEQREERMRWWHEATFGMFIHWGLYALPGRGEWVMNRENIPVSEYEKLAQQFNPRHFAPRSWARLAKEAGMRYLVFTTKHHDGFCLWDSALTDYTSAKTAAKRDFVREYVEACRTEGLRVGFYYSLMDWHHPDGDSRGLSDAAAQRRFVDYVHGQVCELMSNYGRVDILWYDVPWPYDAKGWRSAELNAMVRKLQPHIIINNRSGLPEDFGTPEGEVKAEAPGRAWETCMTLNDNWGYRRGDKHWKDAHEVVKLLGECARGGGNLLLNVGPDEDGLIPAQSQLILRQVGAWLKNNGRSIYGAQRAKVGWGNFGLMTVKGNTLYLLVDKWPGRELVLGKIAGQARKACFLATGASIDLSQEGPRLRLAGLPENLPEEPFTVVAVEFEQEPQHRSGPSCEWPFYQWGDPLKSPTDGRSKD